VGDGPDFKTGSGLSTRRIFHGVVSGVRDYGNRMGIPTVSGAVYFDEDFLDNPLVFCGTLGLIPVDAIHKEVRKGDRIADGRSIIELLLLDAPQGSELEIIAEGDDEDIVIAEIKQVFIDGEGI
jgi:hypothetical protein